MKHDALSIDLVSRETLGQLKDYQALLVRWNTTINLIGPGESTAVWQRHFIDSLQLLSYCPPTAKLGIDLGSGAGFPGLVLAIASGIHFHLIEADRRKAAFLREVAAATNAPATVHASRVELVETIAVDVLTSRALASVDKLLMLGARFLKPEGVALFHKTLGSETEIAEAQRTWHMNVARHASTTNKLGVILELSGLSRAVA